VLIDPIIASSRIFANSCSPAVSIRNDIKTGTALLDFFYLQPAWKSHADFKELRLDRVRFEELIDKALLNSYLERSAHKAPADRNARSPDRSAFPRRLAP
jgi:hypothetical protein